MSFSVAELRAIGRATLENQPQEQPRKGLGGLVKRDGAGLAQKIARKTPNASPKSAAAAPAPSQKAAPARKSRFALPLPTLPALRRGAANGPTPSGVAKPASPALTPVVETDTGDCPLHAAAILCDRADDALALGDFASARDFAQRAAALAPGSGRARALLGASKAAADDAEGLDDLVRAIELDPVAIAWAGPAANAFLTRHANAAGAADYRRRFQELAEEVEPAIEERYRAPGPLETFAAPAFDAAAEATIRALLAEERAVLGAVIVARPTRLWSHAPAFVAAIRLAKGWRGATPAEEKDANERLSLLHGVLCAYGAVCVFHPADWKDSLVVARMKRVKGALVYTQA
ncbi:MAG: hypothetical protein KGL46_08450 [Hyphomicrobiales bacterium]|nr:hypothetical protein [Hyphomicrobiales bacterium]